MNRYLNNHLRLLLTSLASTLSLKFPIYSLLLPQCTSPFLFLLSHSSYFSSLCISSSFHLHTFTSSSHLLTPIQTQALVNSRLLIQFLHIFDLFEAPDNSRYSSQNKKKKTFHSVHIISEEIQVLFYFCSSPLRLPSSAPTRHSAHSVTPLTSPHPSTSIFIPLFSPPFLPPSLRPM